MNTTLEKQNLASDYSVRADGSICFSIQGPKGQHSQWDWEGTLEQAGEVNKAINLHGELLESCKLLTESLRKHPDIDCLRGFKEAVNAIHKASL